MTVDSARRVAFQLVTGTRGGPTRARILRFLAAAPANTNQLARALGADYKTVEHHLRVLVENALVAAETEGYGARFALTPSMRAHVDVLEPEVAEPTQPNHHSRVVGP